MGDDIPPAPKIQTLCAPTLAEDAHGEQIDDASFSMASSPVTHHDDENHFLEKVVAERHSGSSEYKAHILPQEESNDREAQITYAKDASFTELDFPTRRRRGGGRRGGGIKAKIKNFSSRARRQMRLFTAKISRNIKPLHVCLTYPEKYPEDPTLWKTHLECFLKRLDREYGKHPVIWRMEFQDRRAPHFHLMVFCNPLLPISNAALSEFRDFASTAWYEACGEISEEHLEAGTSVERVRYPVRLMRYMAKAESLQGFQEISDELGEEGLAVGRRWGAWNRKLLPIDLEKVKVIEKDAFKVRRILRKLKRMKARGTVRTIRLFVRADHVRRLLEFLGYSP